MGPIKKNAIAMAFALTLSGNAAHIARADESPATSSSSSGTASVSSPASAPTLSETAERSAVSSESKDTSITIYNQNFGLVRDVREIMFKDGTNHIRFDDVAAGIDPTTVSFISLSAPNSLVVREQNYQFDLMDLNTILTRSVGKNVKFQTS